MQQTGRILTVALNAAVDLTYLVDRFEVGREHNVQSVARSAGGKANNVARVAAMLGQQVVATGFLGGTAGAFIEGELKGLGITTQFLPIAGESRTSVTVVDPAGESQTLLREPGPTLTQADLDRLLDQFRLLVRGAEVVVLSGALPPGLPADVYAEFVAIAYQAAQVRCVVDACGPALQGALRAQPYLVKPNREELAEWAGRPLKTQAEVLAAARELNAAGPLIVAVSLGADGLLLVSPEGSWRAVPPQVQAINPVGSGDALVAGFLSGLLSGRPAEEVLRMAVAAGTANAMTSGIAEVDPVMVGQLLRRVRVERLA